MPTKRLRIARYSGPSVTQEVIRAFHAGDEIVLMRALRMRPWETSPLHVDYDQPPVWVAANKHSLASWSLAVELRREIERNIDVD